MAQKLSFLPSLVAPFLAASVITVFGGMNTEGMRPLFFLQIAFLLGAYVIISTRFENPPIPTGGRSTNPFKDLSYILSEGKYVKRWLVVTSLSFFPYQVLFYTPLFINVYEQGRRTFQTTLEGMVRIVQLIIHKYRNSTGGLAGSLAYTQDQYCEHTNALFHYHIIVIIGILVNKILAFSRYICILVRRSRDQTEKLCQRYKTVQTR